MTDGKSTPAIDSALQRAFLRQQLEGEVWADAASAALGVNRTDFSCLRALFLEGPGTAGRLAETTGLTTGAVTGVLDRLEKAAFVKRRTDPDDRRKVMVEIDSERFPAVEAILLGFAPSAAGPEVERFLDERSATLRAETARLRAGDGGRAAVSPEGTVTIPKGALREARLEVVGGAMELGVTAANLGDDLLRAELREGRLRFSEQNGHVRIAHRGLSRAKPLGIVQISSKVSWAVRVSGGRNDLDFDFSEGLISGIDVEGGAGHLRFRFGSVSGVVPLRVNGGASEIAVERPEGLAVEVVARGRISNVSVDGRDLGAMTAASQSFGEGDSRVRVVIRGGMNRVVVS